MFLVSDHTPQFACHRKYVHSIGRLNFQWYSWQYNRSTGLRIHRDDNAFQCKLHVWAARAIRTTLLPKWLSPIQCGGIAAGKCGLHCRPIHTQFKGVRWWAALPFGLSLHHAEHSEKIWWTIRIANNVRHQTSSTRSDACRIFKSVCFYYLYS